MAFGDLSADPLGQQPTPAIEASPAAPAPPVHAVPAVHAQPPPLPVHAQPPPLPVHAQPPPLPVHAQPPPLPVHAQPQVHAQPPADEPAADAPPGAASPPAAETPKTPPTGGVSEYDPTKLYQRLPVGVVPPAPSAAAPSPPAPASEEPAPPAPSTPTPAAGPQTQLLPSVARAEPRADPGPTQFVALPPTRERPAPAERHRPTPTGRDRPTRTRDRPTPRPLPTPAETDDLTANPVRRGRLAPLLALIPLAIAAGLAAQLYLRLEAATPPDLGAAVRDLGAVPPEPGRDAVAELRLDHAPAPRSPVDQAPVARRIEPDVVALGPPRPAPHPAPHRPVQRPVQRPVKGARRKQREASSQPGTSDRTRDSDDVLPYTPADLQPAGSTNESPGSTAPPEPVPEPVTTPRRRDPQEELIKQCEPVFRLAKVPEFCSDLSVTDRAPYQAAFEFLKTYYPMFQRMKDRTNDFWALLEKESQAVPYWVVSLVKGTGGPG